MNQDFDLCRAFTLKQSAAQLNVSVKKARRLIYNGELIAFKQGNKLYILREVFEAYWEKLTINGKVTNYGK